MAHKHYRLIATVRIKNEAWILEQWLKRTSEYVDGIIAIDNYSTDGSLEILKSHPLVIRLIERKKPTVWDELTDRNLLLDLARQYRAEWVHIADPDEIMDARLPAQIDTILKTPGIGRHFFKEVTLWRSTDMYRVDKPEMYHRMSGTNQIIKLTKQLRWIPSKQQKTSKRLLQSLHYRRLIPKRKMGNFTYQGLIGDTHYHENLVRLHYHFVDWNHAFLVHLRAAAIEAIQMKYHLKDVPEIVAWATQRLDESGLQLAPICKEWGVLPVSAHHFIQQKYGLHMTKGAIIP